MQAKDRELARTQEQLRQQVIFITKKTRTESEHWYTMSLCTGAV